jgi:CheY-like chemotaxis protein
MPKILVIDDELKNLDLTLQMLEYEGYDVTTADRGKSGLQLAQSVCPDLIICDVMMPDINGFEVIEALHANPETASIPLIFISGIADDTMIEQGKQLGAINYLVKPFAISDLLELVQVCLSGS